MKTVNCAIVLCGGSINHSNLPIGTNTSNAMVPVNGKPVIGWIMDNLIEKKITRIIVVLQIHNKPLYEFLSWAYADRIQLELVYVDGGTILHSLSSGLQVVSPNTTSLHVVLGDTLITDTYYHDIDYVYSGSFDDSRNWCLIEKGDDSSISAYYDKQKLDPTNKEALVGLYHFTQVEWVKQCAVTCLQEGNKELSSVLKLYGNRNPLKAIYTEKWFDFGHIDHLVEAKRKLLQSRYFNSLEVDSVLSTITKTSLREDKLIDELEWYKLLPDRLKVLAPRLLDQEDKGDKIRIVQEYYGYPNMAELFLFSDMDIEIWKTAIRNLFRIHNELRKHTSTIKSEDAFDIYFIKTDERVAQLKREQKEFEQLFSYPEVTINGTVYKNYPALLSQIKEKARQLSATVTGTVIHGDYCLSNILYDVSSQIVRLIDPRGSFGQKGVYGDPRYDIAKLRHSLAGLYDYIVSDMFTVSEKDGEITHQIYVKEVQTEVASFFDKEIPKQGYSMDEIIFIEGLLFISMLPLHKGKYKRQLMMYSRGIELLNNVLN